MTRFITVFSKPLNNSDEHPCGAQIKWLWNAHNEGNRGVAQSGSAPALGAGGREFESRRPDQPSPPVTEIGLRLAPPVRA